MIKFTPLTVLINTIAAVCIIICGSTIITSRKELNSIKGRIYALEQEKSIDVILNTLEEHEANMDELHARVMALENRRR